MDPISKAMLEVVPQKRHKIDPACGIATQFKPGQSGNRSGRPKKAYVTKIYEKILRNAKNRKEIEQAIFETLKSGHMAGVLLLREAAERTEGKVTQEIDLNTTLQVMSDEELHKKLLKLVGAERLAEARKQKHASSGA